MDMTQEQVAKNLNIVRSTYAYYETGKTCPDFDTVVRLAHLFHVTTDYLLGADNAPPILQDNTVSTYMPVPNKPLGGEWALRESEQKLIIAFRYLDRDMQQDLLKKMEKLASEQYEHRHHHRRNKRTTEDNDT